MNTDRDNFHDWARDKEDTAFSTLQRADFGEPKSRPGVRWGRIVFFVVLAVVLLVGFKYVAGL
jgi:hypothetical protein